MGKTSFSPEMIQELIDTSRNHPKCHVRKKALVVWNVSQDHTYREISRFLDVSLQSICTWVSVYKKSGIQGFEHEPGQGRNFKCDDEELKEYVLQSPRNFGIGQNRWTLKLLIRTVPSLKGFSEAGVHKALKRIGFSYKRGQPHVHSPDPDYTEKKTG